MKPAPQNRHGEVDFGSCSVELKKEGKVWVASCPSLDIHSQGATKDKARENLGEVIRLFIESCSSRGTLAEAIGNTELLTLCVSCHLAEKLNDPNFKKAYEREKAIIDKKVQASNGAEFSMIQLTAEGTKALFELMENPPEPSPALKKAMAEVNKKHKAGRLLKEEDKSGFFELVGRLRMSTDAVERRELKKQLAQMTFGDNKHIGSNFDEIEREKLRKQMKKASRDPLFMKDLDESIKAFEAPDTKKASKKAKKDAEDGKHPKGNFVEFMRKSPLYGVDIDLTREQTPVDVYDAVHTAGGSGHGKRVATGKAILKKQLAAKRKKWS